MLLWVETEPNLMRSVFCGATYRFRGAASKIQRKYIFERPGVVSQNNNPDIATLQKDICEIHHIRYLAPRN